MVEASLTLHFVKQVSVVFHSVLLQLLGISKFNVAYWTAIGSWKHIFSLCDVKTFEWLISLAEVSYIEIYLEIRLCN